MVMGNPLLLHETIVLHFVGVGSRMMMLIDPTWYGQLSSSSLGGIKVFQTPTQEPFPCFFPGPWFLLHDIYIYIYSSQSCCSRFFFLHHNCFIPSPLALGILILNQPWRDLHRYFVLFFIFLFASVLFPLNFSKLLESGRSAISL